MRSPHGATNLLAARYMISALIPVCRVVSSGRCNTCSKRENESQQAEMKDKTATMPGSFAPATSTPVGSSPRWAIPRDGEWCPGSKQVDSRSFSCRRLLADRPQLGITFGTRWRNSLSCWLQRLNDSGPRPRDCIHLRAGGRVSFYTSHNCTAAATLSVGSRVGINS